MSTEIIAAIITTVGVIIAAIIGACCKKKEKTNSNEVNLKQKIVGKNNTQIGIQINKKESDYDGRNP